ncbi:MAG: hypothetical protein ACTHQ3_03420 [Motilibacteraceae bacterium]
MSPALAHRQLGAFEPFDPETGTTLLEPEVAGAGYWVGCPGVLHDQVTGRFLMTYRQRRPRGHHDLERGWRCAIAESADGVHFQDVWEVTKDQIGTSSMERMSLLRDVDGTYLLYLSYVDPADNRWRVDVLHAKEPAEFDISARSVALTAESTGSEGVKDPYAVRVGPSVQLFVSYAVDPGFDDADRAKAHATADIYTSDMTVYPTGLATSADGVHFDWQGPVLDVGQGWDRYQARLNSFADLGGLYLAFYDGSADAAGNYEERTGVALSHDLQRWTRLSTRAPWLVSPHASGSLRYLDIVPVQDEWFCYYEYARPDQAHELRLSRVPMAR